ncbi:MAG: hypothetical protein BWY86_01187 [Candidatus Aminicenantes bacterium ADurb.Bin508]|nr:MAG: hypothetical protein BWY86_01187 [Candidatus Aminicenantes bacterium ADurb.Bin508]
MLKGLVVHADPGVAYGEKDVEARLRAAALSETVLLIEVELRDLQGESPPLGHGVAGVQAEVHHHLFDLASVGEDSPDGVPRCKEDPDVLPQNPLEHLQEARDDLVHVQGLGSEDLTTAEGQKLSDQAGGSISRFSDHLQGRKEGALLVGLLQDQLGVTVDDLKEVVEVMGHPAGELPDRLHLLFLPQLLLQSLPLRSVPHDPDQTLQLPILVEGRAGGVDITDSSVGRKDPELEG